MTTSNVNLTATAAANGAPPAQNPAMQQLSGNLNTFLTLLTTQLKNQDPLSPMDSTQFTQQLVEYSQVEQQINTNTNLQNLISLQQSAAGATAVGYLGKQVTITNGNAALTNGSATWNYSLPPGAASATLAIANANGQIVYSGSGPTSAGNNTFAWNGRDNGGNQLPDGTYTLYVNAVASNGAQIASNVSSTGTVNEVNLSGTSPQLIVGSMSVPLSQVSIIQNS